MVKVTLQYLPQLSVTNYHSLELVVLSLLRLYQLPLLAQHHSNSMTASFLNVMNHPNSYFHLHHQIHDP